MYKTYCTQWTVLLRKGGLLRIHLEEFRVSFITFGIIGKITKQISKQRLQRFDCLFLTCFMLYKDVSKMRVRNIMTCFLFMSQMPDSSEILRFEFPLPLFLCNLLSISLNILSYLLYKTKPCIYSWLFVLYNIYFISF